MVSVYRIGKGRDEDAYPCRPLALRGADKERNRILKFFLFKADTVDPRLKFFGDMKQKIGIPIKVVDVIFMKMNGAILIRRMSPAHLGAIPVRSSHRSAWEINQFAVQLVGSDINNLIARDTL